MKRIIAALVMLGLVGSVSADVKWFSHWGSTGNDLWSDINNWNNAQAPQPSGLDDVVLYPNVGAVSGGLIQMDTTATITGLSVASPAGGVVELEILPSGNLTWTTQAWPALGTLAGLKY